MNIPDDVKEHISQILTQNNSETAFQIVGGSRLFGYANETSDYDIRVVGIPPKEFFMPNLRGVIVGVDNFPVANGDQYLGGASLISHVISDKVKYDVFYSGISLFMSECLRGGYFLLSNFYAPIEKCFVTSPSWVIWKPILQGSMPGIAFATSAALLTRDINDFIRRMEMKGEQNPVKNLEKELAKYSFIADFLIAKELPPPDAYIMIRNRTYTIAEAKERLCTLLGKLSLITVRPPNSQVETSLFKKNLMLFLNDWYQEEVFKGYN